LKDLGNIAALAQQLAVPLPMAHTAAELYRLLVAQGKGALEPSVLVDLLAGRS
jgi:3-hydroxyisobutyrate dehydrogenase-like beta-hydroxyacid dehydrogenase